MCPRRRIRYVRQSATEAYLSDDSVVRHDHGQRSSDMDYVEEQEFEDGHELVRRLACPVRSLDGPARRSSGSTR